MTELSFGSFFVTTCEDMWVNFSPDSVNVDSKVMIGYSSVSAFNWPQRLRKPIDSGSRIDDNFGTVESESHPMQWMMPSVADVASNTSKFGIKNRMSTLSFHVISRFIEISDSWNMALFLFAQYVSMIVNVHRTVVKGLFVLFSFENRWDDDHVVLFGKFPQELNWLSFHWFWELNPWVSLTGAHKKWSVEDFLQTNNVGSFKSSNFNDLFCSFENGPFLLLYWFSCWQNDLWLNGSDFDASLGSQLFIKWCNSENFYFNFFLLG